MVSKHRHWLATWSVALGLLTAHCSSQLPSNLDNYHCSPAGRCLDGYTCSPERLCIRDDDDVAWMPRKPDASTEMSIQSAEEPSMMTSTRDADASIPATAGDAAVRPVGGHTDAGPRTTRDASVSSSASGNANANAGAAATDPRPAPAAAGTHATPPAAGSGEPPPAATGAAGKAAEDGPGAAPTAEAGASAPPATAEEAGSGGLPEQDPGNCRDGLSGCADACVSTAINPQHCSACGKRCHEDQSCHDGKCEKSRGEGLRPQELAELLREHGATLSQFANYVGVSVDDLGRVEISESDLPKLGISSTELQRIGVSRADLARVGVKVIRR
jgi:hypothetical protein